MKTVTFCGHSSLTKEEKHFLEERLYAEIEKLILNGAEEFLLGNYGQFDMLCARVVGRLRKKYPQIKSVLVIPYLNREYDAELYDIVEYAPLEKVPKRFCISKRNEYMVKKADVVVTYVKHEWGGAAKTLEFAKRKKKTVAELRMEI